MVSTDAVEPLCERVAVALAGTAPELSFDIWITTAFGPMMSLLLFCSREKPWPSFTFP